MGPFQASWHGTRVVKIDSMTSVDRVLVCALGLELCESLKGTSASDNLFFVGWVGRDPLD